MQALLELECTPAGMELFPAASESQWQWIKRVIDESDYYAVIVAGRYGTISTETGLSYTEMEYRYALEVGKPIVAFLCVDPGSLPARLTETHASKRKKMEEFRGLVQSRLCKFYSSPADLGAKVSRSITQLRKQHPRPGWVRAETLKDMATSDEVLSIRREKDELRARLDQLALEAPRSSERLAQGEDEVEIDYVCIHERLNEATGRYKKHDGVVSTVRTTWNALFKRIGAELVSVEAQWWHASSPIVAVLEPLARADLIKKFPDDRFTGFKVLTESMNSVMMQLRALGLIRLNGEKKWEITPYGDNHLTSLLAVQRGDSRPRR